MEHEDHLGLLPGLQLEGEHARLDRKRGQEQEVVAGKPGALRVEGVGAEEKRQHQRSEQARPGLLEPEAEKLVEGAGGGPALGPIADARLRLDEVG